MIIPPLVPYQPSQFSLSCEAIATQQLYDAYIAVEKETYRYTEESDFLRRTISKLDARHKLESLESFSGEMNSFEAAAPTRIVIEAAGHLIEEFIEFGLKPDAIV